MLKMALFDCAINEKCCSVDGGRGICSLFSSPPRGDLTAQESPPLGICHPRQKKCQCLGVTPGGGGGWAQVELADALDPSQIEPPILSLYLVVPFFFSLIRYCFLCCFFFLFIRASFKPASLNWAPLTKDCSI